MAVKNIFEDFKLEREGSDRNLRINFIGTPYYPSLEESEEVMEGVLNLMIELGGVTNIILASDMNFVYPPDQTKLINAAVGPAAYMKLLWQRFLFCSFQQK